MSLSGWEMFIPTASKATKCLSLARLNLHMFCLCCFSLITSPDIFNCSISKGEKNRTPQLCSIMLPFVFLKLVEDLSTRILLVWRNKTPSIVSIELNWLTFKTNRFYEPFWTIWSPKPFHWPFMDLWASALQSLKFRQDLFCSIIHPKEQVQLHHHYWIVRSN